MEIDATGQDLNYLLYRQQVERVRAEEAGSEQAREAHLELARHYEQAIEQVSGGEFSISPPGTEN
jgi:hypothetical protein